MNLAFWKKAASLWVYVQSAEDRMKMESLVSRLIDNASNNRQSEKSLVDVLLGGLDEEDDDGY